MRQRLAIVAVSAIVVLSTSARAGQPKGVSSLLERAGNASTEEERLALLKELRSCADVDDAVKSDLDRMIAFVERWNDTRHMTWFSREVGRTRDYNFGIDADSRLYPLTCFYRGRMLVWMTLESGNIIRYADRRRKFLDKAVASFRVAQKAFPENNLIGMYLGEPIPWELGLDTPANAPEWAVPIRENLERLRSIIVWWIDHRMQPNGEYGGGWGDDCEMWRFWVPVLIGFEDPKIATAQARFSKSLMNQPHMQGGYTSRMTDVEHTAEDSADVITPMMHLKPDDPEWKERALRLANLMEQLWTGTNERGFLQFKSTYFTVDRVDTRPERACDTVYHPRAVQPALLLWQRTRDPNLGRLFTAWMDTWVDAAARAENGKPAGIVPSAIHWPDGRCGGVDQNWWDPRNHGEPTLYQWPSALKMLNDTLLLTWHMTGQKRYIEPLRSMATIRLKHLQHKPKKTPAPGTEAWCASQLGLLAHTLAKYRALSRSHEFDELLSRDGFGPSDSQDQSHRQREAQIPHLRESALALRVNLPGYTSEVRWTDRVLRFPVLFDRDMMFAEARPGFYKPNPDLLYSIVTGDPGNCGYFPLNAVRWLTPPENIAARVIESRKDRFVAELYHFGQQPRSMAAEFYLLAPGSYVVTISDSQAEQATGKPINKQSFRVSGVRSRVAFRLPPRRAVTLRIEPSDPN